MNMIELAQLAERVGYRRYWLAEHHTMPGIASAATAVLIGHVAGSTSTLRLGAGRIMQKQNARHRDGLRCPVEQIAYAS